MNELGSRNYSIIHILRISARKAIAMTVCLRIPNICSVVSLTRAGCAKLVGPLSLGFDNNLGHHKRLHAVAVVDDDLDGGEVDFEGANESMMIVVRTSNVTALTDPPRLTPALAPSCVASLVSSLLP